MTDSDTLAVLANRWKTLLACAVLGIATGGAYALLAPKWYTATLTVVPSQAPKDLTTALAAKLPFAADALTNETDVRRIHAVLTSISVADEVIDRFDLEDRYDTDYREQTRKTLAEHCAASVDRKAGVVRLDCEDRDPALAQKITAYFGEVGNRVFGRISASSAREERRFLEMQVKQAHADVDEASRKLRVFQEEHKIVDLPEQSKAVISAMATIEGQLLSKQLELSYVSRYASSTESSVMQLQQQIDAMRGKLSQLEAQHTAAGSDAFFPTAMNVPGLRFELEQLIREQKIRETLFFMLTQRFEMAKVDEARDTSTFQILDHPTLPTYPSSPRRLRSLILGLLGGLLLATAGTLAPAWWRRRRITRVASS